MIVFNSVVIEVVVKGLTLGCRKCYRQVPAAEYSSSLGLKVGMLFVVTIVHCCHRLFAPEGDRATGIFCVLYLL